MFPNDKRGFELREGECTPRHVEWVSVYKIVKNVENMWKKTRKDGGIKNNYLKSTRKAPGEEAAESKHLSYFISIMAETRVSKYFLVAEDTTFLMKISTEQICNLIGKWKGSSSSNEDDLLLRVHDTEQLTEFGSNIVQIGKILGGTQQCEDSFWAKGQREEVFRIIIPMAMDVVKLKRKLIRISDSLIPDLKEFRKLVDIHGLATDVNSVEPVDDLVSATFLDLKTVKKIESGNQNETVFEHDSEIETRNSNQSDKDYKADSVKTTKSGNQNEVLGKSELKIMANNDEEISDPFEDISIGPSKSTAGTEFVSDSSSIQNEFKAPKFSNPTNDPNYMSVLKSLVEQMHKSVLLAIEQTRAIERSWMTERKSGFEDFNKIGDLFNFIRETVQLLHLRQFEKQINGERKNDIIQALDPVYREFHSCFIALGELSQIISTDVSYLKELLENLSRGYSSNSSLDNFEQVLKAADNVDLDRIFG